MIISECNTSRRHHPDTPPPGWLILFIAEPVATSPLSSLFGGGPDIKGMFCTWKCAAEYATVQALLGDVKGIEGTGGEPA